ncbi:MAG: helix-turn-helix transcriptional regulator [Gammaproteobacteria bacterium]
MAQEYLSADQIAEKIGIRRHTVYLWASQGILPRGVAFTSRCRRWPKSEIQDFVDKRRAASGLPPKRRGGGRPRNK